MRRVTILLVLVIVGLFLVGCERGEALASPTNVVFEDGVLSWDEVEGALEYHIYIDQNVIVVQETSYDFRFLENGTYEVWVRATNHLTVSAYALPVEITIDITLDAPVGLQKVGQVLMWYSVDLAEYYEININGTITISETNEYPIDTLSPGEYVVKVRSVGYNRTSLYTDEITVTIKTLLTTPTNIRMENDYLVWDAVDNATSYKVIVDEDVHMVFENRFDFRRLPNGNYAVVIQALGTNASSEETLVQTIQISRDFPVPTNLVIVDNVLTFTKVSGATSYELHIGEVVYPSITSPLDLSFLDINNWYVMSVVAVYEGGKSIPSIPVVFRYYEEKTLDPLLYNKNSIGHLQVDLDGVMRVDRVLFGLNPLSANFFLLEEETLLLHDTLLQEMEYGVMEVAIETSLGRYLTTLKITDDRSPTITSINAFTYQQGQDIVATFELYNSIFMGLSGNDITTSDYSITSGTLTIQSSYFEAILDANPDRSMVILSYTMVSEEYLIIGYLYVSMKP